MAPDNSATPSGDAQPPTVKTMLTCGEQDSYGKLKEKGAAPDFERDHIPSRAALLERAKQTEPLSDAQASCVNGKVKARGMAIAIPKEYHRTFSPTCGRGEDRNSDARIKKDGASEESLKKARDDDCAAMQKAMDETNHPCAAAYAAAVEQLKKFDIQGMINQAIKECT